MPNSKKNEVYLYRNSSSDFSVKKNSSKKHSIIFTVSVIASIIGVMGAIMLINPLLVFLLLGGIAGGTISFLESEEQRVSKASLKERVRKFVVAKNNSEWLVADDYGILMKPTFINSVMDCTHRKYESFSDFSPVDENGNCQTCKDELALIITPELNDHLDSVLEEVIAEEKETNKAQILEKKAQQLKLNSAQTKALMKEFENVSDPKSLKESQYFLEALEKL